MISSKTDRILEETVFWDQGALMHRGGVTAGMEQMKMSFLSKVTSCRFSPVTASKDVTEAAFVLRLQQVWVGRDATGGCRLVFYGVRPHFVNTWDSLSLECDTQPSPSDAGTGSSSPAALQKISGAR